MSIDPVERALELRKTLINDDNEILVVDFSDTLEGKDTSKVIDLMPNIRTGEYVFRSKINVKEIDPLAHKIYGLDYFDLESKTSKEIEDFVKKQIFDFPLWFKHNGGFDMKNISDYNIPLLFQVDGCNFHDGESTGGCKYCFVDDKSNNGIPDEGKTLLSVDDTVNSFLKAKEKIKEYYSERESRMNLKVLRCSGGEPTIVLDWILDLWDEMDRRGFDIVGQLDSNLSTGRLVNYFEEEGIYEENILRKLARHPIKVLTAIKGVTNQNIKNNVQADFDLENQMYSLKKFLEAGFDIYPQMYNPDPNKLEDYLIQMDKEIENFSLRVHVGPLKVYSPTIHRLGRSVDSFSKIWDKNYEKSCKIIDSYLRENYGVGYKENVRSDVELKLLD